MSEPLKVKLSGAVIGRAASWKVAEAIVRKVLNARGVRVPQWDGSNTVQDEHMGGALCFFIGKGGAT